jgi:hypothetical protein
MITNKTIGALIGLLLIVTSCNIARQANVTKAIKDSTSVIKQETEITNIVDTSRKIVDAGTNSNSVEIEFSNDFDFNTTEKTSIDNGTNHQTKIAEISKDGIITLNSNQKVAKVKINGQSSYLKIDSVHVVKRETAKQETDTKATVRENQKTKTTTRKIKSVLPWILLVVVSVTFFLFIKYYNGKSKIVNGGL